MTIVYSSYTNGDDTTGTGTSGNPYKTIYKASTGLTGGDEVREEKSPVVTALSGTLAYTDGSKTVTTSVDLTSSLAQGDFIHKDGEDDWNAWEVDSITSTVITLYAKYSGDTETISASKINITDLGTAAATSTKLIQPNAGGSSTTSHLKISGGWDLSTTTQDGFTYFTQTGVSRYGYGFDANGKSYLEYSHICFLRCYRGWTLESHYHYGNIHTIGCYYHGIYSSSYGYVNFNYVTILAMMYNSSGAYAYYSPSAYEIIISNLYILSSAGRGMYIAYSSYVDLGIVVIRYNENQSSIVTSDYGGNTYINNLLIEHGTNGLIISSGTVNIGTAKINNCTSNALFMNHQVTDNLIIGDLSVSGNTNDVYINSSYDDGSSACIRVQKWNVENEARVYFINTSIMYKDSAEAKGGSGYCLRFDPSRTNIPSIQSLGLSKVTSTGSDITMKVWVKDDASFNGSVDIAIFHRNKRITGWNNISSITTSYVEKSIIAASGDLIDTEFLELKVRVYGSTGNVYIDDFSVS